MKNNHQWRKRLFAMFLSIAMVFSFMPVTTNTFAKENDTIMYVDRKDVSGLGTQSSPYIVTTWDGLKECLNASSNNEGGSVVYIKAGSAITDLYASEINVDPEGDCKTYFLDLNGKTILTQTSANQPFTIKNGASLTINDSAGGGVLYHQSNKNQIFYVKNGTLNINGGIFQASYDKYIIHNENGTVRINGGTFNSFSSSGSTLYSHGSNASLLIRNGNFNQHATSEDAPVIHSEYTLNDTADVPTIALNNLTDEINLNRTNGSGLILKCEKENINLCAATKTNSFGYRLDGNWLTWDITNQKTLKSTELKVAYKSQYLPKITSQPKSVTVNVYQTATFTISATNTDSYTWWVCDAETGSPYGKTTVESNADVSGWNSSTFTIKPKNTKLDGLAVYCALKNDTGSTYSNDAILTIVDNRPVITSQPQDATVSLYGTATFTVTGTNVDSYQWYVADYDTGQPYSQSFVEKYANVSGWNSSTFKFTPKDIQFSGMGIYCQLSNDAGNTYSDTALLTVNEPTVQFTDVDPNEYYYEPIMWAVANGITSGTSNTTFSPDADCTRAQVVTFIWRAFGKPTPKTYTSKFTDVTNGGKLIPFYTAIIWATEQDITSGTSDTLFSPFATCTRAQVATFLWRAAGEPTPKTTTSPFTDVKNSGATKAFYKAILWAVENGITTGTSDTTFSPNAKCTRAQVVTFLYRMMKQSL